MNKRNILIIILIFITALSWFVYSGILMDGKLRTGEAKFNYFSGLADSFLEGRLDIQRKEGQETHDLVSHGGKYYLYWPPVPAVVYMPLKMIFGEKIHDNLVTAFFGALNTGLFAAVILLISRRYAVNLKRGETAALVLFWAFGTVHLYLSMSGKVWAMPQVMAQTFLLSSLVVMLSGISPVKLAVSGFFFALCVYTRNNLVFSFFMFAAVYFTLKKKTGVKAYALDAALFLGFFFAFSFLNMAYNAARFDGNPFENGIQYHLMSGVFAENYEKHGYFSLFFIPYNFFTEVIQPFTPSLKFPFFRYDPKGFGFLWESPLFLAVFPAGVYFFRGIKKYFMKKNGISGSIPEHDDTIIMAGCAVSVLLTAGLIFMIMGNGRSQFGARYTLDFYLMLIIFGIFALKEMRSVKFYAAALLLLVISVYMNYFGARMVFGY